ncbi:MAG: type II toxin-antitoxin system HicB family antitoxin [Spirochaetia bacterium]
MAEYILSDYISKALARAVYEKLGDGTYAGKISECTGVLAFGNSLRECEEELQSTLEDWVLVGLKKGHQLPVIDEIDLNKAIIREPLETL